MNRTRDKRFKKDYSKKVILDYIRGVRKVLGKSPSSRDLGKFPGPSSRTIVRRFGYWSKALKEAGFRPQTNQLIKGEKTYIRRNWRKMTDKQLAKTLAISP